MSKEALKLALEALESCYSTGGTGNDFLYQYYDDDLVTTAITAIKEALAQPEQHQDWCASLTQLLMSMPPKPAPCNCKPPQRTWVGLTDEEQQQAYEQWQNEGCGVFYRAIEAKLRSKNNG